MKNSFFLLVSFLLFSTFSLAQQRNPAPTPLVKTEDNNVVKISTTLIQLDVVVTDKKGNQVTDLKPEDFEVLENGAKQDITNFSYITASSGNISAEPLNSKSSGKLSIPVPPVKLKPGQIRRTYAIVVDDLGISFSNIYWVQQSLRKFVKEQMQEGDLAAILRTGVGVGALQSFTSNKNQLLAAIDKIKWNSQGRGGVSSFDPVRQSLGDELNGRVDSDGKVKNVAGNDEEKEFQQQIEDFRNENFAVGTLGALNYIIGGMRELPGRKSVMLISEGFPLFDQNKNSPVSAPNRVLDSLRVLADLANRSSVVIYTVDPRGLDMPFMATAEDDITQVLPGNFDPGKTVDPRAVREREFNESQTSLRFLAYETGGLPYVNQNNINKGLEKVLDDQKGYYLIGYQPNADTFDPKKNKFNKLSVKLKRDDLKVRYRSGFFGITDEKISQTKKNPHQKLASALVSPFGADEMNVELYSFFYNDDKNRSFMRSLVYIDPKDLTFTQDAKGNYQTKFDIMAMIFDSNGVGAGNNLTTQTLRFTPQMLEKVRKNGIIYDLPVPIIKPGAYQFRIALQDTATEKIGAASKFVEIPNLNKKRLTLSNLILKQFSLDEWKKISLNQSAAADISKGDVLLNTVVRKFERGTVFTYSFVIYNARLNQQQKPQIKLQARLFRDGKLLMEGQPSALDTGNQSDFKRLEASGAITLGSNLPPGDYVLQAIVIDENARQKRQVATQWIDFEIVE